MDDWQDWDIGEGLVESDEEPFELGSEGDFFTEEPDYQSGYRDLERITGTGTATVEGVSKRLQRSQKSPEEAAMDQVRMTFDKNVYQDFPSGKKEVAIDILSKNRSLPLMNIDTAVAAALWLVDVKGKEIDKKMFKQFSKKFEPVKISPIDLYRYIRLLTLKK